MYVVILNDDLENARVYENLSVLNKDLDMNPYTMTNFFSRNKGQFYRRGRLTVIKTGMIDRKFLKALYNNEEEKGIINKLDKDQRDLLDKRKTEIKEEKTILWSI